MHEIRRLPFAERVSFGGALARAESELPELRLAEGALDQRLKDAEHTPKTGFPGMSKAAPPTALTARMTLRLRSVAEADAAGAIRWYVEQKPDLALPFFRSSTVTLETLSVARRSIHAVDGEMRRALFPNPFHTCCSTGRSDMSWSTQCFTKPGTCRWNALKRSRPLKVILPSDTSPRPACGAFCPFWDIPVSNQVPRNFSRERLKIPVSGQGDPAPYGSRHQGQGDGERRRGREDL